MSPVLKFQCTGINLEKVDSPSDAGKATSCVCSFFFFRKSRLCIRDVSEYEYRLFRIIDFHLNP